MVLTKGISIWSVEMDPFEEFLKINKETNPYSFSFAFHSLFLLYLFQTLHHLTVATEFYFGFFLPILYQFKKTDIHSQTQNILCFFFLSEVWLHLNHKVKKTSPDWFDNFHFKHDSDCGDLSVCLTGDAEIPRRSGRSSGCGGVKSLGVWSRDCSLIMSYILMPFYVNSLSISCETWSHLLIDDQATQDTGIQMGFLRMS